MGLFSFMSNRNKPLSVERDSSGNFFYTMFSSKASFKEYNKLEAYKTTYALNTVIGIIKDTAKLANFNLYKNGKLENTNYLYQLKPKPNPYQTWTDFIEEYAVWYLLGTAYYYKQPGTDRTTQNEYWLNPDNFDNETKKILHKFGKKITSASKNELIKDNRNHIVKYQFNDKDTIQIPLKDIIPIHSQPALENWYSCNSNIDALVKVINNSESALDSKNINLHFTQKYLVFQKDGKDDMSGQITGLTKTERDDINNKVMSNEKVIVSGKSNVELKRFIENLKQLGFDESFLNDYLLVGIRFGVPLEILGDFLRGKGLTSQGDAKEKAMVQFVDMCLMPILQKLTDVLELLQEKNQEVKAEFTHLWFMKFVLKQKEEQRALELANLKLAQELGIDITQAKNNVYGS